LTKTNLIEFLEDELRMLKEVHQDYLKELRQNRGRDFELVILYQRINLGRIYEVEKILKKFKE
jgi:hypothetical protein